MRPWLCTFHLKLVMISSSSARFLVFFRLKPRRHRIDFEVVSLDGWRDGSVVFVMPLRAISSEQSSFLPIFWTNRLRISNLRLGVANPRTGLPSCMMPMPTPSFMITPDASSTLAPCMSSSAIAMLYGS